MKCARWLALLAGAVMAAAGAAQRHDGPVVVLISIDGLRPDAVTEASTHGLQVPNLRAFMRDGAWAAGVRGVLPTLTYPSHASILTGASPSRHGILSNTTFDPYRRNQQGWYWYAEDVRVPTLWDAAAAAHLTTANVYWPVSVGAPVMFNLPQIWRTGTDDDRKLQRALSTPGLEQALSKTLGRYPGGMEESVAEDEIRARFALRLFDTRHPDFMTIYFTGLDTEQHASGPFSAASDAVLERIDTLIGRLRDDIERHAPGRATICVVSDHGFAAVAHDVNLASAFLSAGLFSIDEQQQITAWQAMPWPAGGGAAVMLADPSNEGVKARVGTLLASLAADPANGIDRVLTHGDLLQARGFPDAAYFVSLASGYELGSKLQGALITASANRGMHGYVPERPEMRASFFLIGPQVPAGRALGDIDMRQIAPTLAMILRVPLPQAELAPLRLQ
jgi:predicted AlkP superfamily pyrophosphatase or phosphodiesterase